MTLFSGSFMKKTLLPLILLLAALSGACVTGGTPNPRTTVYDLGTVPTKPLVQADLPALAIARVTAPEWLNGPQMYYRLAYVNSQQPRPYANSQWIMSPARLFEERIKSHIGQAGGQVMSATSSTSRLPTMRIEIDDFTHVFESPEKSYAQLIARVAVLEGRKLVGQRTFTRRVPAPTPNADGGAKAMAQATDAMMANILRWLDKLPLR
jgi:cholesterol transport system auxiliary component